MFHLMPALKTIKTLYIMCTFSDDFQIEREKSDLSVQVISLSERLEESEGGVESHVISHLAWKCSPLKTKLNF